MSMLSEKRVEIGTKTFEIKQLPLGKSQEVFMYLLNKAKGLDLQHDEEGNTEINWVSVVSLLNNEDVMFLRERLLNANCHMLNDNEKWVPVTKHVLEAHLRLGQMVNLLAQALAVNYSDFLADLDIESLAAQLGSLVGGVETAA